MGSLRYIIKLKFFNLFKEFKMHSKIEDFNIQDLIINFLIVNIQDLTHNLHWFVYLYINY